MLPTPVLGSMMGVVEEAGCEVEAEEEERTLQISNGENASKAQRAICCDDITSSAAVHSKSSRSTGWGQVNLGYKDWSASR